MIIFLIILLIGVGIFAIVDYIKVNNELRRCPKCNTKVKQPFSWDYKNNITAPGNSGDRTNVTIYKCQNCGYSWNHVHQYTENNG